MPEATSPQGTATDTALSFNEGVDGIADLLSDSDIDPNPGDEDEAQDEAAPDGDAAGDADVTDPVDDEGDGSQETQYSGGQFVPANAKFKLEDGTVITVADLARNNLYQRDYTRKTTEHAEKVRAFEAEAESTRKLAQGLAQERDFLMKVAGEFLPKEPDASMLDVSSPNYDPVGYTHQQADYNRRREALQRLMGASKAEQQRAEQEKQRAYTDLVAAEREKLHTVMPELQSSENFSKFWGEASKVMAEYGFSEADLREAIDHRFYPVMRDLARYKRALAKAPKAKEQVQAKPKLLPGGKRMNPNQKNSRDQQARTEALRQTGSFEAGVAALMDLNL